MKSLILTTVFLASSLAWGCGSERWAVKTSVISQDAVDRTLLALTSSPAPARAVLLKLTSSRLPSEIPIRVQATVKGYKLEADGDIHIVLTDGTSTMVAEIPDPVCIKDGDLKQRVASVRQKFIAIFGKPVPHMKHVSDKTPILFTGQLFFDFLHGQDGAAKNGAEIHPVVSIE